MFYVYEHIRPDTNAVFYVGKGSGYRDKSISDRNRHWHFVVNKSGGFKARKLFEHFDEELVLLAEQEKIDQLRKLKVKLCNFTNGGEGISGFKHREESKEKMRNARKNITHHKHTEESKEKIRKASTGVVFSEERKRKISEKALGRKVSEETKAKQRLKRFKHKPETIEKMCKIQQSMPKTKCLHCEFVGSAGNLARWHNFNCKYKGEKNE